MHNVRFCDENTVPRLWGNLFFLVNGPLGKQTSKVAASVSANNRHRMVVTIQRV